MKGYWYLASPYTRYKGGKHEEAFRHVCKAAGQLLDAGLPVFSPIAHSHPIAIHGDAPSVDLDYWLRIDEPLVEGAQGIIVLKLKGWDESTGVRHEIGMAQRLGKPILFMEWDDTDD